ncbi:succinate dehydrogenase [ubiquinone] cytochrome b subunit, mitochondrial [Trichomonascus vanleenenianus]|uniref:succinate dehydrogenase [ubiquinone] cytochrome b subunit, mitochondrial n=1 Tax=Trichomonascus vanleenenianus TaxID=2268995 RepID=UPI003ECB9034
MLALRTITRTTLRASSRPLMAQRASQLLFNSFAVRRPVTTQSTTPEEALEILKRQRSARPVSPHLQIYQPQLTWVLSSFHRITGVALGFAFYGFLIGYAGLPLFGVEFDSNSLMSAFGALPLVAKLSLKFVASLPFTFHFFNGLRHLVWDTARELTLKGVYRTGYAVLGLSAVSSLILTVL